MAVGIGFFVSVGKAMGGIGVGVESGAVGEMAVGNGVDEIVADGPQAARAAISKRLTTSKRKRVDIWHPLIKNEDGPNYGLL